MSEVVVDTGWRATPTCKLEDGLPYSEVVHYWGEVGVPMKAFLTPRHRHYRIMLGGAVTVRVAIYVPEEPLPDALDGEDAWAVYFAARVSTTTDMQDFGTVDDWDIAYPTVDTEDYGARVLYQYPMGGGGFGGPTITIAHPCRKMATISDYPRYPDYTSDEPVRWGKKVGDDDEVIDLRDWRGASLDWWHWPPDGQISVTISMPGMAPFTFTTEDIWHNRVDGLTPSIVGDDVVDAIIRHSGAIVGDNEMINRFTGEPWDGVNPGDMRIRMLPGSYTGTIKLDAFNGGPNWSYGSWGANMRAFGPEEIDYGANNYVTVSALDSSLTITHESYQGPGITVADDPESMAGGYYIHLTVDPAVPLALVCDGRTLPQAAWPEDTLAAYPFAPLHPDPPVLNEVVTRFLHATVDCEDEALTLPVSGALAFGGRHNAIFVALDNPLTLVDWERDDRPKTQAGEDGVPGYQFSWALLPSGSNSLQSHDVDPNCWRVVMNVPALTWPALRRRVYSSFTIEDFASGVSGWAAVGGETVSNTAEKLRIEGANPKAVEKTYEPGTPVFWDSFRFLAIQCTSAAADVELTVTIGTKTWTVTGDATGKFTVDLCAPSNASGIDYSTTRYEREYADGKRELSEGGWGWGLNGLLDQVVRLSFATADDVLVDTIYAALKMPTSVPAGYGTAAYGMQGCISTHDVMRIQDTTGENPLEQWAQPVIRSEQTGKVTLMEEAGYLTDNPSPGEGEGPQTKTAYTIADVSANIHGARDTVELPAPVDRGRLKTGRKGLETVEALGKTVRTPSSAGTLSYYEFADYCNQCAEAYDLFLIADAESETGVEAVGDWAAWISVDWLRFGPGAAESVWVRRILGGSIDGIVHGVSTPAAALCPVQLVNPSDADDVRDEAVTDPAGYYTFPSTAVPIDLLTSVVPATDFDSRGSAGITTSWGAMLINGVFTRVCLMFGEELPTGDGCDYHMDQLTGQSFVAYANKEGLIKTARSHDNGKHWELPVTVPNLSGARRPSIVVNHASALRPWGITYDVNGAAAIAWSTDNFYNREYGGLMTGVTHVRAAVHPVTGVMLVAGYRISDGMIVSAYSTDHGATLSAVSEVCAADEHAFGLHYAPDSMGTWTIVVQAQSWSEDATYAVDARAVDPADGKVYRCKSGVGPTATSPSADTTHWELVSTNTVSTYWSTDNGQHWDLAA
jgi:hypothetical protein